MFYNSTTILRIFGIDIRIAASWFLIAALVTWSLANQVFPVEIPGQSAGHYLLLGSATMIIFFASLLLHELAHALVARYHGIEVPTITLFLFGGVAELGEQPKTAGQEFWIAVAGPAMSLTLASIFWVLSILISLSNDVFSIQAVLGYLAKLNLVLAIFNVLPAFPLDGGRVLRAILWSRGGDVVKATEQSARLGEFLAFALMIFGLLSLFQGLQLSGAWLILLGLFILFAARGAVESLRTKTLLGGQMVADVMSSDVITTDPDVTLDDLVDRTMLPHRVSFVPVVEKNVLLGHIDTTVLAMIDRDNWPNTCVGDVFVGLDRETAVSPGAAAIDVLKRFAETGTRKLLVVEDAQLVGVVTLSDLGRLLHLMSELQLRGRDIGQK